MANSIQPCIRTQLDGPDFESTAAARAEEALSATLPPPPVWAGLALLAEAADTGEEETEVFWAAEESQENSWEALSRKD